MKASCCVWILLRSTCLLNRWNLLQLSDPRKSRLILAWIFWPVFFAWKIRFALLFALFVFTAWRKANTERVLLSTKDAFFPSSFVFVNTIGVLRPVQADNRLPNRQSTIINCNNIVKQGKHHEPINYIDRYRFPIDIHFSGSIITHPLRSNPFCSTISISSIILIFYLYRWAINKTQLKLWPNKPQLLPPIKKMRIWMQHKPLRVRLIGSFVYQNIKICC